MCIRILRPPTPYHKLPQFPKSKHRPIEADSTERIKGSIVRWRARTLLDPRNVYSCNRMKLNEGVAEAQAWKQM